MNFQTSWSSGISGSIRTTKSKPCHTSRPSTLRRHGVATQTDLYKKELIALVCKDVADYTRYLISKHNGCKVSAYRHAKEIGENITSFYGLPFLQDGRQYE